MSQCTCSTACYTAYKHCILHWQAHRPRRKRVYDVCAYLSVCVCVCVCAGAHAGPPEAPYSHLAVVLWIRSPPTTPPTTHSVLALLPNRSPHPRENGTAAACPEYARPLVSAGMQVSCCLSTRDTLASVHLPSEAGAGPQGVFWESDTFTVPGVCVPEGSVVEGVGVVCWRARDLSQEASSVDEGATEQWLLGTSIVTHTHTHTHTLTHTHLHTLERAWGVRGAAYPYPSYRVGVKNMHDAPYP